MTDILLDILRTHLADQEVGPDDDFYAMGGDSLIALRVVSDAQGQGIPISLRDLLYYPTAHGLAEFLQSAGSSASDGHPVPAGVAFDLLPPGDRALIPEGVADALPATALQVGMIYLCETSGDAQLYQSLIGWKTVGRFDKALFRQALSELCARHPALRTYIDLGRFSAATQLVRAEVEPPLSVESLPEADPDKATELVRKWREERLNRRIDWTRAPMFRCHVVAEPESFQVTLATHHAIVDGWGFGQLIVDLLTIYDARLRGVVVDLPQLPFTAHRDFAIAEKEALASHEAAVFWRAQADVPTLLIGQERFGATANAVGQAGFSVEPELLDRLRDAARGAEVSLKAFVLGVHAWALGKWSGRGRDIVTGVVINIRPETPGSDLVVGLHLNTIPMRFGQLAGSWADLAREALAAERHAAPYRTYPLAEIENQLGRAAFDVTFNFTNFHVYQDLDSLHALRVCDWWVFGKPSFPFRVDFEVEGTESGSRVLVDFDPGLVAPESVRDYVDIYRKALAAAAQDPTAAAGIEAVEA
ncbi:condensation domain-containing protein [Streptomyces sp. NBC_01262]|uniref:condensation domain-containing protein n=1 Tax=Streptomyces sp. NBC_01262 TaxID=2903803 RepID=UPI002E32041A|nr:condensation domain-containing protein [Streptomyces sp. NBC_01262]